MTRDNSKTSVSQVEGLLASLDKRLDIIAKRQEDEANSVRLKFEEQARGAADIKEKLLNVESALRQQGAELAAKLELQSRDVVLAAKENELKQLREEKIRMDTAQKLEIERISTAKDLEKKTGLTIAGLKVKDSLVWGILAVLGSLIAGAILTSVAKKLWP